MAPYPTKAEIEAMFSALSTPGADFFSYAIDDVDWTIMGHLPLSQVYADKAEFRRKALQFLGDRVLTEPLKMHVVNVVGGSGEESMAAVEMKADAVCRNGEFWVVAMTCFFWRLGVPDR